MSIQNRKKVIRRKMIPNAIQQKVDDFLSLLDKCPQAEDIKIQLDWLQLEHPEVTEYIKRKQERSTENPPSQELISVALSSTPENFLWNLQRHAKKMEKNRTFQKNDEVAQIIKGAICGDQSALREMKKLLLSDNATLRERTQDTLIDFAKTFNRKTNFEKQNFCSM